MYALSSCPFKPSYEYYYDFCTSEYFPLFFKAHQFIVNGQELFFKKIIYLLINFSLIFLFLVSNR
ncbi:unnamed protein product [Coffea canephora]|uniref:DH200=94 genomic scaffold, scaffold_764 n=1 Tax=Coffea canephora TaxID=49390 RepID=A0A068VH21_COFCA|nr:unnamed protein product [Coffea canephora]